MKGPGNDAGEAGEREDIDRIVMQDRHDAVRFAVAQVIEVDVRDHFARQIALALEAENLAFKFYQPATIEAKIPQASRPVQKVEMAHAFEGWLKARHTVAGFKKRTVAWQKYHSSFHTSSLELGEIANKAKPKLLVLYHQLVWTSNEQELMRELQSVYKGEVKYANDLDVY